MAVFDRLPSERHWPAVAGWVALAEVGQCLDSIGRTQLLTAAASGGKSKQTQNRKNGWDDFRNNARCAFVNAAHRVCDLVLPAHRMKKWLSQAWIGSLQQAERARGRR